MTGNQFRKPRSGLCSWDLEEDIAMDGSGWDPKLLRFAKVGTRLDEQSWYSHKCRLLLPWLIQVVESQAKWAGLELWDGNWTPRRWVGGYSVIRLLKAWGSVLTWDATNLTPGPWMGELAQFQGADVSAQAWKQKERIFSAVNHFEIQISLPPMYTEGEKFTFWERKTRLATVSCISAGKKWASSKRSWFTG